MGVGVNSKRRAFKNKVTKLHFTLFFKGTFFKIVIHLERWWGRERESFNVREKHPSVASHTCTNRGLYPQPRCMPWLGIEPRSFRCKELCSNQVSHTGQGTKWLSFKVANSWNDIWTLLIKKNAFLGQICTLKWDRICWQWKIRLDKLQKNNNKKFPLIYDSPIYASYTCIPNSL